MATGGTASGTHTFDELDFLPPPDPPVDKTKTVEEQVAELKVHRDQFIKGGHKDFANLVQVEIDELERKAAPQKKKRRSGDAAALGMTKEQEYYEPTTLSHGGQGSYSPVAARGQTRRRPTTAIGEGRRRQQRRPGASTRTGSGPA